MTSKDLTTERLLAIKGQTPSSKSESGSTFSHRSHHSSSKDSSGRTRSHTSGARTSIIVDGGVKLDIPTNHTRPLSVLIDGLTISVGAKDKDDGRRKEQKRIEKAPSVTSRTSKRSGAESSVVSSSKGKERDDTVRPSTRGPSNNDEQSHVSSKRSSRAPSSSRASVDYSRSRKSSDARDYDRRKYDDTVYGG